MITTERMQQLAGLKETSPLDPNIIVENRESVERAKYWYDKAKKEYEWNKDYYRNHNDNFGYVKSAYDTLISNTNNYRLALKIEKEEQEHRQRQEKQAADIERRSSNQDANLKSTFRVNSPSTEPKKSTPSYSSDYSGCI